MATKRTRKPTTVTPEHAIDQIHAAVNKVECRVKGETLGAFQSFRSSPKIIIGFAATVAAAIGGFWLFSHFKSRRNEQPQQDKQSDDASEARENRVSNPLKMMLAGLLVQAISTGIETWGKSRARAAANRAPQAASED